MIVLRISLFCLSLAATGVVQAVPEAAGRDHLHAVELARQGDTGAALAQLEALYRAEPSDALLYDLIAVAHWHEDDAAVLAWAEHLPSSDSLPDYALRALARSHRNLAEFEQSLLLYRDCLVRWPDQRECRLGEALVMAEVGDTEAALSRIDAMIADEPRAPDLHAARGYIQRSASNWLQAAEAYRRAAELAGQGSEYRRLQIVSLLDLGAPIQAQTLAERYPQAMDPALAARLAGDVAARHINWVDLPARDPNLREQRIERADRMLSQAEQISDAALRQRFDRLLLADRQRQPQVVLAMADAIETDGHSLPDYVLAVVASAHLDERQPEMTLARIGQMSPRAAAAFDVQVIRIYALEESGQYPQAIEAVDALVEREPRWRRYPGLQQPQRNNARFRAERLAAMMRAYGNRLAEAEHRLDPLVDGAPLSAEARADQAAVYNWRGWPRQAIRHYQIVLSHAPEHSDAHLGLANLHAERGQFQQADKHWQALQPIADTQRIQRARQRFDRQHGWALDQRFAAVESTGDVRGEREWRAGMELRTPVFGEGWRGYLGSDYQRADFPEGRGRERVDRVGVSRRQADFDWAGGLHRAHFNDNGQGVHGRVRWQPSDFWHLAASVAKASAETPLRGRNQDVGADQIQLAAGWRWSESQRIDASTAYWDFTDGNRRQSLQAAFEQRLFADHQWQLDGRLDAWASRNREGDFAYFNPRRDASLSAGLEIHQRLFRDYDHLLRHRLQLNAGLYHQADFGHSLIGGIAWRPRWDLSPLLAVEGGISLQSRVYDGQREQHLGLALELDWRWP